MLHSDKNNLIWIPLKAYGGFLIGYEDIAYLDTLERTSLPLVRTECFAFEIAGTSMTPDYKPGDFFVGTPLETFNDLVKKRDYVFQTIDGLIVKRFEEIKDDYIYLSSINELCNPVPPIFLKEIKKMYHKEYMIVK